MPAIRTLAFFDTETTGLPAFEWNRTRITELALVACSVEHLRSTPPAAGAALPRLPRVLHKLSLCVNPRRPISGASSDLTRLDNGLLEHQRPFDAQTARLLSAFLAQLPQPVCLVAHNGDRFDYPLLRKELRDAGVELDQTVRCVDSLVIFRRIDELAEQYRTQNATEGRTAPVDLAQMLAGEERIDWRALNETTPRAEQKWAPKSSPPTTQRSGVKRKLDATSAAFGSSQKPGAEQKQKERLSYKLQHVYERLFDVLPRQAHCAEADVLALVQCVLGTRDAFLALVDDQSRPLSDVVPQGQKSNE